MCKNNFNWPRWLCALLVTLCAFCVTSTELLAEDLNTKDKEMLTSEEQVILAGGCFWGMEEIIRTIPGVLRTRVGYSGGTVPGATYEIVSSGRSGHAESVEVTFDPKIITFESLLGWFFRMHDPTTINQQGNDRGTQYRSAIFYTSEQQKQLALETIEKVNASRKWPKPIVTQVVPAGAFYEAEEYHQDYLQKHPGGYTCHYLRDL